MFSTFYAWIYLVLITILVGLFDNWEKWGLEDMPNPSSASKWKPAGTGTSKNKHSNKADDTRISLLSISQNVESTNFLVVS